MNQQSEKLTELLKLLQNTQGDEIDCDEFGEKMAYLAELSDGELSLDQNQLKSYLHHLTMCPGCAEAFALVRQIVVDEKAEQK